MIKNFFQKIKSRFGFSKPDRIKDVLENLIEDDEDRDKKIDDGTKKIFKNVFEIDEKCIEDIMVPRADIDAISEGSSLHELITYIDKTRHSRIPVYNNNLDKITGMIHIRDIFRHINQNGKANKKSKIIKKLMRKILFSSPSMKILDLLLRMRSEQIHMSIVIDEFGGTNGLVTIEDLVEEIVGEIKDEHDFEQDHKIKKVSKKTYEVSARITVNEIEDKIGKFLKLSERNEVDTLGGLVFFLVGRIPERGEVISHSSGIEFSIIDADTRRIKKMQITLK
ncbi:MAG: magnesium/cobalt efflux protein [Rickettsiales bacterium]|nr:magnesium/cobalt efflux protein [Rickettsiales bacterium]